MWGRFTLEQIARFDDIQLWNIVFRRRDENGQLVRDSADRDLPDYVRETMDSQGRRVVKRPVPFKTMFRDINKQVEDKEKAWKEYRIQQALLSANMERELEEQMRLQYNVVEQMEMASLPKGTIFLADVMKYNK